MDAAPLVDLVPRRAERLAGIPPPHLVVPSDSHLRVGVPHLIEQPSREPRVVRGIEGPAVLAGLHAQIQHHGRRNARIRVQQRRGCGGRVPQGRDDAPRRGAGRVPARLSQPVSPEIRRCSVQPFQHIPGGGLADEQVVVVGLLRAAHRRDGHAQGEAQAGQFVHQVRLGLRHGILRAIAAGHVAEGGHGIASFQAGVGAGHGQLGHRPRADDVPEVDDAHDIRRSIPHPPRVHVDVGRVRVVVDHALPQTGGPGWHELVVAFEDACEDPTARGAPDRIQILPDQVGGTPEIPDHGPVTARQALR